MVKLRPLLIVIIFLVPICGGAWAGYCGGWLARPGLLLQLARRDVEIVIPACEQSWVFLSPSGRTMAVFGGEAYLEDLRSGQRSDLPASKDELIALLTDEIVLYRVPYEYQQFYLFEAASGRRAPIVYVEPESDDPGFPMKEAMEQARQVIIVHGYNKMVILGQDPFANPELNFITSRFVELPGLSPTALRFNIPNWTHFAGSDMLSPDGRFFYRTISGDHREEGIYETETGHQLNTTVPGYFPRFWAYDGVILSNWEEYLIPLPEYMGSGLIEIPQPILKLKLPSVDMQAGL